MKFSSLWVGGELTSIQKTCLSSFVYYGKPISLYVYDLDLKVPKGVVKKDARKIVPETQVFTFMDSYAPFADVFRYQMIKETGDVWVDADTLLLTSDLSELEEKEYIFTKGEFENLYLQGVLKAPKDSQLISELVKKSRSITLGDRSRFAEIGPFLFDPEIKNQGLEEHCIPLSKLCLYSFLDWKNLWDPSKLSMVIESAEHAYMASVYTSAVEGVNRQVFPSGSAMEYFYNKFVL